jgi:hypothetical protein
VERSPLQKWRNDEPRRGCRRVPQEAERGRLALYEVEGKEIFEELTKKLPSYSFHITEGPQVQEILLGVNPALTAFFTQRTEFNAGVSLLRPGALLTVTVDRANYPMLFLHTKSGDDPRGLGLRDDMLVRAFDFRRALDCSWAI